MIRIMRFHQNLLISQKQFRRYFAKYKQADSFSQSVLLPKTSYAAIFGRATEKRILQSDVFTGLYHRQREDPNRREEFVLHDGPPYANGEPHLGHAVNKILKDIIIRSAMIQGKRVTYVPGWDCHGLPIELKVKQREDLSKDPVRLRKTAEQFSYEVMQSQCDHFMSWGVTGDWETPYLTASKSYVLKELQVFYNLFKKNLVYRSCYPVYWSVEYETALAEAELEYREDHISPSVYVKFPIVNSDQFPNLHALIWTTTPWTLPSNEAICYAPGESYQVIELSGHTTPLLVASKRIEEMSQNVGPIKLLSEPLPPDFLKDLRYRHPVSQSDQSFPFLSTPYVTMEKGTGLMHSAPNHGKEDHVVAQKYGLKSTACLVDSKGRFTDAAGPELAGQSVLHEGSETVMKIWSDHILHRSNYQHSYPYDWRSKKPVIIRSSQQWFFDTAKIHHESLEALDAVKMQPEVLRKALTDYITSRSQWCISRQRVWGVPIPAFYRKDDPEMSRPVLNDDIFESVLRNFKHKGPDAWWTASTAELLPDKMASSVPDLVKGSDILDIWFDSGVSWTQCDGKQADLYLEGKDQLRGWFLSSLLTSVASNGSAPYKSLFVHGFALDKDKRKMSKSIGNVINPSDIVEGNEDLGIPAFGVDILRWWVSREANDHADTPVDGDTLLKSRDEAKRMAVTIRFLIGSLFDFNPSNAVPFANLLRSDQLLLALCYDRQRKLEGYIQDMDLKSLHYELHALVDLVSRLYFVSVKNRLYCFPKTSLERKSAQTTMWYMLRILSQLLAPVIPLTMEDAYAHFPGSSESGPSIFEANYLKAEREWQSDDALELLKLIDACKQQMFQRVASNALKRYEVHLQPSTTQSRHYLEMLPSKEWRDWLQVSSVVLRPGLVDQKFEIVIPPDDSLEVQISAKKTDNMFCPRCRIFCATGYGEVCDDCEEALNSQ